MAQRGKKQSSSQAPKQKPIDQNKIGKLPAPSDYLSVSNRQFSIVTSAMRFLRIKALNAWIALGQAVKREVFGPDIFCWIPVVLGLGIIAYFTMNREPNAAALGVLVVFLSMVSWRLRSTDYLFKGGMVMTLLVAGIGLAKWETERASTPILREAGTFELSGRVTNIVPGEQRSRLILRGTNDLSSNPVTLAGVQLSAFNQHINEIEIGDNVWVKARLEPLSGPIIPNGYDFRRIGYFDGLSARGFLLGEAVPELNFQNTDNMSATESLTGFRKSISDRLKTALPGESGALASALLVGIRSGISDKTEQALRNSGLAHILAISGLHMALVTALLFGTIRLSAAFAHAVSAKYQVKKWAAGAALLGALGYLALSGAGISAQRAFLMAAIFLVAIMFNRAALTMRNVALAAIAILVIQPSAILTPGFQMSFMAVIALVAVYRRDGLFARIRGKAIGVGAVRSALTGISGLALTSIVAGFATAPFAVHHFYQFAVYGLAGNLAAMPLVGFIVMPTGILALLMMPFGIEWLPLGLMKLGLDGVVAAAEHVSAWEGAVSIPGQQPAAKAFLLGLALICFCLMHTKLRFVAASIIALSAMSFGAGVSQNSVLLISQDGKMMAEVTPDGLAFRGTSRNSFVAGIWMRAFGDGREVETVLKQDRAGQVCDRTGCHFEIVGGKKGPIKVASIKRAEAMFEACTGDTALIISALYKTPPCPGQSADEKVIIDESFLTQRGSVILSLIDDPKLPTGLDNDTVSKGLHELGLSMKTSLPIHGRHWN